MVEICVTSVTCDMLVTPITQSRIEFIHIIIMCRENSPFQKVMIRRMRQETDPRIDSVNQ
jgi:hypothetical protein